MSTIGIICKSDINPLNEHFATAKIKLDFPAVVEST